MNSSGRSPLAVEKPMDREVVFAVLVATLCGGALVAAGWWWPAGLTSDENGTASERETWWRIWLPFGPAAFVFALLCGWLLVEPASAEPVPKVLMLAALLFGFVFVRAAWRASRSLALSHTNVTLATVGFFRLRIICAPQFADSLDQDALAAAMEHERAHARHRDPLRIWLAQFGTELLWPAPAALTRLHAWKRALEISRDDEARAHGASGPDLAAAIVVALRFNQKSAPASCAYLAEEAFVRERVARLLQPLEARASSQREFGALLVALLAALPLTVVLGIKFGEMLIGSLLTRA